MLNSTNKFIIRPIFLIIVAIFLAVTGFVTTSIFRNAIKAIEITPPETMLEVTYGDSLDLSSILIEEIKNNGESTFIPASDNMLKNFDETFIGEQIVTIEYKGETSRFIIRISPRQLDAPIIHVSDNSIYWEAIDGATSYSVRIGSQFYTTFNTNFDMTNIDFSVTEIEVGALSNELYYSDSVMSTSMTVSRLGNVEGFSVEEDEISWSPVAYADGYYVRINDQTSYVYTQNLSYSVEWVVGENSVEIFAVTNENDYIPSNLFETSVIKLEAPQIEYSDGVISLLNPGDNLDLYDNGDSFNGDLTALNKGNHEIKAIFRSEDSFVLDSDFSNIINIYVLDDPIIYISGNTVTWTGINNADEYLVYINDEVYTTNQTRYDISSINSEHMEIHIVATSKTNSNVISSISNTLDVNRINPVNDLVFNESSIQWDPVSNADKYLVSINGYPYIDVFANSLDVQWIEGVNTISIYAVNESLDTLVNSLEYSLSIEKLPTPVIAVSLEELTFNYTGYNIIYYNDGVEFNGDLTTLTVGMHQINIRYTSLDDFVLSSNISNTINVTKLSVPVISISNEVVTSTCTGTVEYYIDGSLFDGDLSNLTAGVHNIYAKQVPESIDDNEITSDLSTMIEVTKNDAPIISILDNTIVANEALAIEYYLDGAAFDGDLEALLPGSYVVSAVYSSTSSNVLESELSNEIIVQKIDYNLNAVLTSNQRLIASWDDLEGNDLTLTFKFYKNGVLIDEAIFTTVTETYQYISYIRNGVTSDHVEVSLVVEGDGLTVLDYEKLIDILI